MTNLPDLVLTFRCSCQEPFLVVTYLAKQIPLSVKFPGYMYLNHARIAVIYSKKPYTYIIKINNIFEIN